MMEFEVDEFNHSEEYSNGCTIYGPYDQRRLKGLKMKIDLPTQFQIYFIFPSIFYLLNTSKTYIN